MPRRKAQHCALCGRKLQYGEWIHSSFSKAYFCADWGACDKKLTRKVVEGIVYAKK